jgi:hypothetical protein
MDSSKKSTDAPILAAGGIEWAPRPTPDPFRELDDLMAVVEVLCPIWPTRKVFTHLNQMLL